ncbi:DUF484 family protein [Brevundimonas sp. Root1279]|uniref:DUF484 family protein n=1 Tax=Brevundimonas sp. Root1279 TaxID=1736443 RepID=UPI0006FE96CE|nr:DUF484 family protein [Brevundimonas sp. Root1279]KQW86562.1 hypothetical protein ASC65_01315 [Brevundimonas sp. Root1279]
MSVSPDLSSKPEEPHWPEIRAWLQANPQTLLDDRSLLEEIGLKPHGRNVVEFGRAALTRLEEAAEREADARKRIEAVARANFAAQTQTHVAALDLMEARSPSDLARRLDAAAQGRFGLAGAAIALEKPGGVPFGWRALEAGGVDKLLGEHGLTWLGANFAGLDLFGAAEDEVKSVALIRMAPQFPGAEPGSRHAICAFGSPEEDGFTPTMGCELVAFIARVVERTAERWPILN